MSSKQLFHRLLLTTSPLRASIIQPQTSLSRLSHPKTHQYSTSIVQPSFWASLIPKPFRHPPDTYAPKSKKPKSNEWNPGTFYIWIYLLIGSMSIQMIALKMRFNASINRADAKISLLKEVIERVQKGEDVDVAGLLGKGNKQQEEEWEEVLREVENESQLFKENGKKKSKAKETESSKEQAPVAAPPEKTKAPSGFY